MIELKETVVTGVIKGFQTKTTNSERNKIVEQAETITKIHKTIQTASFFACGFSKLERLKEILEGNELYALIDTKGKKVICNGCLQQPHEDQWGKNNKHLSKLE
jgi:hypothetical protein